MFKIAMHDASPMRHFDRGADLPEQGKAMAQWEVILRHITYNRCPRHVLHDEVGQTVRGRAGVEKRRDIGMIKRSEDLPLGAKSIQHFRGVALDRL